MKDPMGEMDTLPKLLLRASEAYAGEKVALRHKEFGIWKEYSWKDYCEMVKYFSLGLISLTLKPENKVAVIGDNSIEYYVAEMAIQSAKGICIPLYSDAMHSEIQYILNDCEAQFIIAHDQEQVDKLLQIKQDVPSLKKVIYWDPKGLWDYDEPFLMNWREVVDLGKKYEGEHHDTFETNINSAKGNDLALIMYTSGTTGLPKGAMLSHKSIIFSGSSLATGQGIMDKDEYFSYMSPSWITEQLFGIMMGPYLGMTVNFAEKAVTVQEDIREIGPTIIFYGPRLWESIARTIQVKISDTDPLKRLAYRLFLPFGQRRFNASLQGKNLNFFWRVGYKIAWSAFFRELLDKFGLSRIRVAFTAGTVLSPETFAFIGALGLKLRQVYGVTEAGIIAAHTEDDVKRHTLGRAVPGVEIRIDEGELVIKSPGLFTGYFNNPEETAAKLRNGYFYSGDAGFFDEDGHLIYMDRLIEVLDLPNGEKFSPQFIESTLRFSAYIADAMVVGKDKPYISVVIIIGYENVGKWAEDRGIVYTTFTDLSQKPEVYALIQREIERANTLFPIAAKIKKFVNLHKELDPDEAELTRTRKLRRSFMEDRYKELVGAIYSDKKEIIAEATVKFRDGKESRIKTSVMIGTLGVGEKEKR